MHSSAVPRRDGNERFHCVPFASISLARGRADRDQPRQSTKGAKTSAGTHAAVPGIRRPVLVRFADAGEYILMMIPCGLREVD
jgi:hypothetical protein